MVLTRGSGAHYPKCDRTGVSRVAVLCVVEVIHGLNLGMEIKPSRVFIGKLEDIGFISSRPGTSLTFIDETQSSRLRPTNAKQRRQMARLRKASSNTRLAMEADANLDRAYREWGKDAANEALRPVLDHVVSQYAALLPLTR